jgi:hypothetical protein
MHRSLAAGVAILLSIGVPAAEAETPKRGGSSRSTSLAWSESDYMSPLAVGWDRETLWGGRRGWQLRRCM